LVFEGLRIRAFDHLGQLELEYVIAQGRVDIRFVDSLIATGLIFDHGFSDDSTSQGHRPQNMCSSSDLIFPKGEICATAISARSLAQPRPSDCASVGLLTGEEA
jgi:hypothetical protein